MFGEHHASPDPRHSLGFESNTDASHLVLAVARTMTSTVRLLENLEVFRNDPRVETKFYVDPGSRYGDGVTRFLLDQGARVLSRAEVLSLSFSLVVMASENAEPVTSGVPEIVWPHGVGFYKLLRDPGSATVRLAGIIARERLANPRLVLVAAHEDQRVQAEKALPGAGDRIRVVGDPAFERLIVSERLRTHYRQSLGVPGTKRLIFLSSTWGPESLLGGAMKLPERLLRELPADEFAVCVAAHPNVAAGVGYWQLRSWLGRALDAGLILLPPTSGWQAGLVAADLIVGDHGSVSLYGAALSHPLLVVPAGEEVLPDSPIDRMMSLAPTLDTDSALLPQITAALNVNDEVTKAARTAFDYVHGSTASHRKLCYSLLELTEPPWPAEVRAWPLPQVEPKTVNSFVVHTRQADDGRILLARYPAIHEEAADDNDVALRHIASYNQEERQSWWENARVVIRAGVSSRASALEWVAQNGLPHKLSAAQSMDGLIVGGMRLTPVLVTSSAETDPMCVAGAVYHLVARRLPLPAVLAVSVASQHVKLSIAPA